MRIPVTGMAAAALSVDQAVDVRAEDGRIIIDPVKLTVYTLDECPDQMKSETLPEEIGFGPPVGKELWSWRPTCLSRVRSCGWISTRGQDMGRQAGPSFGALARA